MKKMCWFIFIFLISSAAYSQNWSLFPPTQKSLYSNFHGYEDIRIDSILIQGDTSTLFFNDRVRNGNCLIDSNMNFVFWGGYFLLPKTAIVTPKLTTFHCIRNGIQVQFDFKQHSTVGETWAIAQTNLNLKCESIDTRTIFGVVDSIKYFNVYTVGNPFPIVEYEYILSKNFGLIQFTSINQLAFEDTVGLRKSNLLGFRMSNISKGFVVPDFNDFFHLHASDVLVWKYHEKNLDIRIPDKIYYYKDSILKAEHTADIVKYIFKRTKKSIAEIDSIYFARKEFDDYLIQNPSHFIIADKDPIHHFSHFGDDFFAHVRVEDINISSSYTEMAFYWSGWFHHKDDCEEGMIFDVGSFFTINTKVGILNYGIDSWGTTTNEVVGSIINGVASGITSIPTSIPDIKNVEFSIYPNPANTTITIQGDFNTNTQYKIANLQGQIVQEGNLSSIINIENLPSGLFYLQIIERESLRTGKFVKISN